ncbi:hypothetical protein PIB30_059447 [Stylosanthes scabra]|uniref:TF-B3 domain-containing protein n=1 Tax=Stylosanthes scabra TaxID=79078 RepID=A0ABU6XL72_9FABA|nr:hypothetical protein [Stylosanthes scabra]
MASPSTVICFFKIVLRKTLQHGILKIPKKFCIKYGDGVPNPVCLKTPDGIQWKVDWSKCDGKMLFKNGWKEFAAYYSLDNGHMLWFEYNGTSKIEVHILDTTGLEIDYPSTNHNSDDSSVEISNELPKTVDDDNSIEAVNEPPQRVPGRPSKKAKAAAENPSSSSPKRGVERGCNKQRYQSEETGLKMPTIQSARVDMDIIQAAKKFKSKNPSFIIKIRQTELTRAATSIPAAFFREHFKEEKEHLNLCNGKKQWPATLIYYPVKKSVVLSSGWRLFAQENKLKAGDICIFVLVYREGAELHAYIFRRTIEGKTAEVAEKTRTRN